jgi:hypothetical protein
VNFGTELPDENAKPLLTRLTEAVCSDFSDARLEDFATGDIVQWIRHLDPSDATNRQILSWVLANPGWVKLLAGRVKKFLESRNS